MSKLLLAVTMIISSVASAQTEKQQNEKLIRNYFQGFKEKNWTLVETQLDQSFTFTSPAPDDHINVGQFKKKCWPQSNHIKDFEFVKIIDLGEEAVVMMHVITNDNKLLRNVEYFKFKDGKIASIEVFFGGSGAGYPTNAK